MKKFFEMMTSRFKEFWGGVKSNYFLSFFKNKYTKEKNFTQFIFKDESCIEESYFDEDSGDFCVKTKYCLCVARKTKISKKEVYNLINYDRILTNSNVRYRFDKIDICFWLYPGNKPILIKRKIVVIEIDNNN